MERGLFRPLGNSGFRLLFAATSVSSVGTLLAAVALAIDVKDRAGSHPGNWIAALMIVEFLPTIVIGFAFGPLLDRLSRRGLMVGADVARAAVFCALPFVTSAAGIVALAAVAGVANGFFRPAAYAGLPNLVADEELAAANGLIQGVENISWAVGPLLGGLLAAAWGPHVAYWVNAVSFVASALLVVRIPQRLLQSAIALSKGYWHDVGDGLQTVRRSRELRAVLVSWSIAMAALGAVNVGEIFLAKNSFHAGDFGYGLLYGAVGVGLVIGSIAGGELAARFSVAKLYGTTMVWMAACFAATAVSPNVWVGSVLATFGGIGNGVAVVCNILLVQRGASDEMRGRALTVVMGANYVVMGVSSAVAGPLVDAYGARWLWGVASAVLALAGLAAAVLTRGLRVPVAELPTPDLIAPEPELGVPLASGQAPPTG